MPASNTNLMYLHEKESALDPASRNKLEALQARIYRLYQNQKVFSLSLETLELTRRFNDLYKSLNLQPGLSQADHLRLLAISRHLEKNLFEELP